jgi:hypothetical protein
VPRAYRIQRPSEEAQCPRCGCPGYVGERAWEAAGTAGYCSRTCAREAQIAAKKEEAK